MLGAKLQGRQGLPALAFFLARVPHPWTSETALSWEWTMGEAGPTRNRKSRGRAWERGRQGGPQRADWGLRDHRKSSSARKRKGEAEVLGRDTHQNNAVGEGWGDEAKRREVS